MSFLSESVSFSSRVQIRPCLGQHVAPPRTISSPTWKRSAMWATPCSSWARKTSAREVTSAFPLWVFCLLRASTPRIPWWPCHPCLLEALRERPNRRASAARFRLVSLSRAIRLVASTVSAAGRTVLTFGTLRCGPHLSKCFMIRGTWTRGVLRAPCTVNSMRFCVTRRGRMLWTRVINFDAKQAWGQRKGPILRAARRRHGFPTQLSACASGRHAPFSSPPRQHRQITQRRRNRCQVFRRRRNDAQRL
jgi:hypothetical protein